MTESLTISGLALKIFLNKHYYNNIPLINKKDVFDDIHKSYYGGRVEVFNPLVSDKSYSSDENSLYPFASLNDIPG